MLLEVCIDNIHSAQAALAGGAHRLEVCSSLSEGGLTPSYGLVKSCQNLDLPLMVMIRPRGGDFVYSDADFEVMKKNVQAAKDLGVEGIVSGILNSSRQIDIARTKTLIDMAQPLSFTFHRAFDVVDNPFEALEELIDLGVDRVLTSGQADTAIEGIDILSKLVKKANERITILAGGGVNGANAGRLLGAGLTELHASASVVENNYQQTKIEKVKAIVDSF